MAGRLALQIITRAGLRDPEYARAWQWPEEIPPIGGSVRDLLLNNPLAVSEADPVQIVATTDTQVVGRVNLITGRIHVGLQDVCVLWGSGLDVAERFRHTGAGLMLMLRMGAIHPTVCVVGISKIVTPIYEKLRWEIFAMKRFVLLCHSGPILGHFLGHAAGALARPFAGAALGLHSGLLRGWIGACTRRFRVEELPAFPPGLDSQLAAPRSPATCHRSATWVNWLLAHHTGVRRLFLVRGLAGQPLGYFITTTKFHASASSEGFRNLTLGSIKDWMVLASDQVREIDLLLLATRELCREPGVDAIEVCLPDETSSTALRRLGFLPRGDLRFLFRAAPGSPLAEAGFRDRSRWWFRPADGDNFFF